MSYADRLNKLNDSYQKADSLKGSTRIRPEDGEHHLRIDKVLLEESKRGKLKGCLQVVWYLSVVAGSEAGKKAFKRTTLEGPNAEVGYGILKGDLETLGFKLNNLQALTGKNGVLQKVLGKIILVRIVTANDPRWYNIYFNEKVEEMPESEDIETAQDTDDSDFEKIVEEIDLEEEIIESTEDDEHGQETPEDSDDKDKDTGGEDETDPDNWALDNIEVVDSDQI